ncbi:hypothetical protein SynSYN20_01627 [Synechococcus sp. SYN20]|nr:hypothetical protein SynSYN20_01627 [Synechococcus sp. SYN20]
MQRQLRTPEEVAAFKAANLAANARNKQVVVIKAERPAPRPTQRQQFAADLRETEDMIRAAKRQGLLQAIPALIGRHNTLTALVNNAALT